MAVGTQRSDRIERAMLERPPTRVAVGQAPWWSEAMVVPVAWPVVRRGSHL
jgi:hypothetical protein